MINDFDEYLGLSDVNLLSTAARFQERSTPVPGFFTNERLGK
jgi:hypothetical protein